MAKIISADVLSKRFNPEQSLGAILANYLPEVRGTSPFNGFSAFSAEKCHETKHGEGTCSMFSSRDNNCQGMADILYLITIYSRNAEVCCSFKSDCISSEKIVLFQ